jgi:hypothetical protein
MKLLEMTKKHWMKNMNKKEKKKKKCKKNETESYVDWMLYGMGMMKK